MLRLGQTVVSVVRKLKLKKTHAGKGAQEGEVGFKPSLGCKKKKGTPENGCHCKGTTSSVIKVKNISLRAFFIALQPRCPVSNSSIS